MGPVGDGDADDAAEVAAPEVATLEVVAAFEVVAPPEVVAALEVVAVPEPVTVPEVVVAPRLSGTAEVLNADAVVALVVLDESM